MLIDKNNLSLAKEETMTDTARMLFGSTNLQGCVPNDAYCVGPVFSDDGRLIVNMSWTAYGPQENTEAVLSAFDEDTLVETWRVWDCYTQEWAPTDVTVLRYENADVVVRREDDKACVWVGAVDTQARILASGDPEVIDECCWQWLRDSEDA